MSKKVTVLIVAVVVFVGAVVFIANREGGSAESITIGAVLPLTGDLASYGQNARDGITLLAEQVNERGGVERMPGSDHDKSLIWR